jgi:hypothetical protein
VRYGSSSVTEWDAIASRVEGWLAVSSRSFHSPPNDIGAMPVAALKLWMQAGTGAGKASPARLADFRSADPLFPLAALSYVLTRAAMCDD